MRPACHVRPDKGVNRNRVVVKGSGLANVDRSMKDDRRKAAERLESALAPALNQNPPQSPAQRHCKDVDSSDNKGTHQTSP